MQWNVIHADVALPHVKESCPDLMQTSMRLSQQKQSTRKDVQPVTYALHTQYICSTHVAHAQYIRLCICLADQADQCHKDSIAIVTASLVNDVHSILTSLSGSSPQTLPIPQLPSEAMQAVKSVNPDSIVLMSHSAGAVTAVDMLAGKVPGLLLCFLLPYNAFRTALHCLLFPSAAFLLPRLASLIFCNAFCGLWLFA